MSEVLLSARDGGVLTLTLNRPEALNALNRETTQALRNGLEAATRDREVGAVILTGAGRAFCAGADLGEGGRTFDRGTVIAPDTHEDGGGVVTLRIYDMNKPVIAAINGPAVGFGVTFTLPMDIRIASTSARLGFVFARRGVVPEACSTWFLPRLVGIARAAEWVYTGRVFDAAEALAAGLVTKVVPTAQVVDAARALAREMADGTSAMSIALARQLLWRMLGADHPMEAHKVDSRCIYWMGSSADAHEGVASFLEKRPPRFTLRPSADMPAFYPWWRERKFE